MGIKSRLSQLYFPDMAVSVVTRRMGPASGIVLMYHEVLPDEIGLPAWIAVRESEFRWQMEYLGRYFDVVTMEV